MSIDVPPPSPTPRAVAEVCKQTDKPNNKRKRMDSHQVNEYRHRPETATVEQMRQWADGLWISTTPQTRHREDIKRLESAEVYWCYSLLLSHLEYVWVSIYPVDSYVHARRTPSSWLFKDIPVFNESRVVPQLMKVVCDGRHVQNETTMSLIGLEKISTYWWYAVAHSLDHCAAGGRITTTSGVEYVECPKRSTVDKPNSGIYEMVFGRQWTFKMHLNVIDTHPSMLETLNGSYAESDALANRAVCVRNGAAEDPANSATQSDVVAQMIITFENVQSAHQMQMLAKNPAYRAEMIQVLRDSKLLGNGEIAMLAVSYLDCPHAYS